MKTKAAIAAARPRFAEFFSRSQSCSLNDLLNTRQLSAACHSHTLMAESSLKHLLAMENMQPQQSMPLQMSEQPIGTDPLLAESSSATRARSPPDTGAGSERKRRRKVLSCYDCRRRKLQCDRVMPACGRCVKAGQAASCLYLDDAADTPVRPARPETGMRRGPFDGHYSRPIHSVDHSGDLLGRLEFQDSRIKQLESALAQASAATEHSAVHRLKASALPITPESVQGHDAGASVTDRETMLLRGKSFKTQFHGTSHPGALLAHMPELNLFTKDAFERFPALQRIRQDMHSLEDRTAYAGTPGQNIEDRDLRALVPPGPTTDEVLRIYFDTYDCIYHIIHAPAFWRAYNDMWANGIENTSTHFIALVLLMMASVLCLTTSQPSLYIANSSTAREKAVAYIQTTEDWLQKQSQKHVTEIDFQIRCLLLLAKQNSARKYKRTWTETGNLVRFCMSAGLHRNPELLRKPTSALDKELRKRIWATVVDLELQTSFDRGMISSPFMLQSDCDGPSNVRDEDFAFEQAPASRPASDFTCLSYLSISSNTVMLRSTMNAVLNNIRHVITFEEVKQYTDEIDASLRAIPDWKDNQAEGPRALLVLRLLQYQLALHDRYLRASRTVTERNFSTMVIFDTVSRMVDTHQRLLDQGNSSLELLCQDQLRSALSLAHLTSILDPKLDSVLFKPIEQETPRMINQIIDMLTDKVVRFGREQRNLWMVLAANGYIQAKKDPDQRMKYMQEAVENIARPYYQIMACQEDAPVAVSSVESSIRPRDPKDFPNAMTEYLPPVARDGMKPELAGDDQEQLAFDFDDVNAWTFEDWMFDPGEAAQQYPDPFTQPPASAYML